MRVDFYLLENQESDAFWILACRLLEKAWLRKHRIFVFCHSREAAETLDERLWTFKDQSFIPHNLQGEGPDTPPAVQIGYGEEPQGFNDILLNLSPDIPVFAGRFKRIMEIVKPDEIAKGISRMHYKEYKSRKYVIYTHNVAV